MPAGFGIILKKGTWHDFPVSCGPPVSCFILNTEEVVAALAEMVEPAPMDQGDCFKLRMAGAASAAVPIPLLPAAGAAGFPERWLGGADHWDFTMKFPDPRCAPAGLSHARTGVCVLGQRH